MVNVVGDVGGSSSRWALLRAGTDPVRFDDLPGFNPATGDPAALTSALRERIGSHRPTNVLVYGAGCGAPSRAERMRAAIGEVWGGARIEVSSDLLGSARGTLNDGAGLVLILGTGMNAGRYDGRELHCPMPSLGYLLGDEGSGADLGKHAVRAALLGDFSSTTTDVLFPEGLDHAAVIERVYRGPAPQAWLAGFAVRLVRCLSEPAVQELVRARFTALADLLARYFSSGQRSNMTASGSVALGFHALLAEVLSTRGFTLNSVVRDPLDGLVRYHAHR